NQLSASRSLSGAQFLDFFPKDASSKEMHSIDLVRTHRCAAIILESMNQATCQQLETCQRRAASITIQQVAA
ncbi:MAG: hypothetical protein ACPHJ3_03670, partial [Rubripirellula sp.]